MLRIVRRARALFIQLALCLAASAGCSLFLGLEPPTYENPPPPEVDGEATGQPDSGVTSQDGRSADVVEPPPAPPFDEVARWASYDGLGSNWYAGTFDGRFVYFIRAGVTRVVRYDTQQENAFDQAASWTSFDPALVAPSLGVTYAITFDGRYVIVANYDASDAGGTDAAIVRYDTESGLAFDSSASWETFDANQLTVSAGRFVSAATYRDASFFGGNSYTRPFLRRAPGGAFDAGWEPYVPPFDASACNRSNFGAACAGDFVYFGPGNAANTGDCIVRYDVRKSFGESTSWECFSLAEVDPDLTGMQGSMSDGKYVYVTEVGKGLGDAADLPRRIGRHPASSPLDAGWEFRSATLSNPLATRYFGGTFDGRFVYFAPFSDNGVTIYLRYDTLRPFSDDAAWSAVPGAQMLVVDSAHSGAIFDGKYVYYPPRTGRAVRYRARDDRVPVSSCSGF